MYRGRVIPWPLRDLECDKASDQEESSEEGGGYRRQAISGDRSAHGFLLLANLRFGHFIFPVNLSVDLMKPRDLIFGPRFGFGPRSRRRWRLIRAMSLYCP